MPQTRNDDTGKGQGPQGSHTGGEGGSGESELQGGDIPVPGLHGHRTGGKPADQHGGRLDRQDGEADVRSDHVDEPVPLDEEREQRRE